MTPAQSLTSKYMICAQVSFSATAYPGVLVLRSYTFTPLISVLPEVQINTFTQKIVSNRISGVK